MDGGGRGKKGQDPARHTFKGIQVPQSVVNMNSAMSDERKWGVAWEPERATLRHQRRARDSMKRA